MTKQLDAKFHHKWTHQQMPEAMIFRHSVTMATRTNQNNNKGRIQPNGKKNNENAIQMKPYNKMIAEINFMNSSTLKLPIWRKGRHSLVRYTAQYTQQETSSRCYIQQIWPPKFNYSTVNFILHYPSNFITRWKNTMYLLTMASESVNALKPL